MRRLRLHAWGLRVSGQRPELQVCRLLSSFARLDSLRGCPYVSGTT